MYAATGNRPIVNKSDHAMTNFIVGATPQPFMVNDRSISWPGIV